MVFLLSVVMVLLAVTQAQVVVPAASKIQTLEKQVEILTNLVYAQSNVLSKFSCQGASSSNSPSECILKVANQAKQISKLEGDLKALQSRTQSQENNIQQLQTTVSDLSKKLKNQETKLASLDSKYASEVAKLRSGIQSVNLKTTTLTNTVNQLGTKVQQVADSKLYKKHTPNSISAWQNPDVGLIEDEGTAAQYKWPSGSYCILASGSCPAGFSRRSGYMRAISLYAGSGTYINQGTFGDSKIQCHGSCGQYGHWTGELYMNACCK